MDINAQGYLTNVTCFPNSPGEPRAASSSPAARPSHLSQRVHAVPIPSGIAISADNHTAYAVLDNNDTLTKIDLTQNPPVQVGEVRVGNVPNSVVLSPDGTQRLRLQRGWPYCCPERLPGILQRHPVVANYPAGSIATSTISVVNLGSFSLTDTIFLSGLHPTGMALWGQYLLVADAYSDVTLRGRHDYEPRGADD